MKLYRIKENNKWGYIDIEGNIIILPMYDAAREFNCNHALVKKDEKTFVIDQVNEAVLCPQVSSNQFLHDYSEGFIGVENEGYYDRNGNLAIPFSKGQLGTPFSQGHAITGYLKSFNRPKTIIDAHGNIKMTEGRFYFAFTPSEGLLPIISKDNELKEGFMNLQGEIVIECQFNSSNAYFSEGLCGVSNRKDNHNGYINHNGEFELPCQFSLSHNFHNGLARGHSGYGPLIGYFNKTGEWIIPERYTAASDFNEEGIACVRHRRKHKYGFIDKQGNYIIHAKYHYAENFKNGLAFVSFDEKYSGYIDINENIIWQSEWNDVVIRGLCYSGTVPNGTKLRGKSIHSLLLAAVM